MLSNLLGLLSRRARADYQQGFVREVNIRGRPEAEDRKFRKLLWLFWVAIVVKCLLMWWLIRHYHIPFSPWWVVAPTLLFAALVTAVYVWRD